MTPPPSPSTEITGAAHLRCVEAAIAAALCLASGVIVAALDRLPLPAALAIILAAAVALTAWRR